MKIHSDIELLQVDGTREESDRDLFSELLMAERDLKLRQRSVSQCALRCFDLACVWMQLTAVCLFIRM